MAEPEPVTEIRRALPEQVDLDPAEGMPPHSPREMSLLEQQAGRSFQELVGEGAPAGDNERALLWFKLRRLGYEPTWDECNDVLINYKGPDPTSGGGSSGSPPSATSGA